MARYTGSEVRERTGPNEALLLVLVGVVFAVLGIFIGLHVPVQIPPGYARFTAVMILAALDSILGAVKGWLNGNFENKVFVSGLLVNSLVAGTLTYLGDKLGVDLYIAAIVAFGVRIFDNIAVIRRHLL
jgi:small basic protein